MRVQYASDLHLEFPENRYFLANHPLQPVGDVLLLAGDIGKFNSLAALDDFFDELAANFKLIYWIPGNHEYYGYELQRLSGSFCEAIRDNLFLVNDHAATVDGIRFIFSTLWTKITPARRWAVERGMNDFRLIRYHGEPLNAVAYNQLHGTSLDFIKQELAAPGKKVVMTHHVPTLAHYPPEYLNSPINQGFAVELSNMIETSGPDAWCYSHHHRNIPEFRIGETGCSPTNSATCRRMNIYYSIPALFLIYSITICKYI